MDSIVKLSDNNHLQFWCPGCKCAHVINYGAPPTTWSWNNDLVKPTILPSISLKSGHFCTSHKQGDACWCTYNAKHPDRKVTYGCSICHSYVTDGKIQFLADSTHALADQTVDLPGWPKDYGC